MVDAATGGGPQHGRDIDQLDKDIRQANQPATLASVTPATASSQMLSARGTQAARSYRRTEQATANPGPKFPYIDSSGGPGCQWRRVMSNDPSPLKYMGTQSQESVAMEAAMAAALRCAAADWAAERCCAAWAWAAARCSTPMECAADCLT